MSPNYPPNPQNIQPQMGRYRSMAQQAGNPPMAPPAGGPPMPGAAPMGMSAAPRVGQQGPGNRQLPPWMQGAQMAPPAGGPPAPGGAPPPQAPIPDGRPAPPWLQMAQGPATPAPAGTPGTMPNPAQRTQQQGIQPPTQPATQADRNRGMTS